MKATILPKQPDAKSPAGAFIHFLINCVGGNLIHRTVPPHKVNKAAVHATESEFWYILEGNGEIWRENGSQSFETGYERSPFFSGSMSAEEYNISKVYI
jgi:mannose-6-phosphate isomerase-like protein (cupin superfamily)